MSDISSILVEVGARLRQQRELMNLNQAEFGQLADVTRGSQAEYELGKRPFSANYLIAMRLAGVDTTYVLTGERSTGLLSDEAVSILTALDVMSPTDRRALAQIACSLAGQEAPEVQTKLPSTAALAEAFGGILDASPGLSGDELAHELATRLPIILRSAEDEIATPLSGSVDGSLERPTDRGDDRRAAQL